MASMAVSALTRLQMNKTRTYLECGFLLLRMRARGRDGENYRERYASHVTKDQKQMREKESEEV